MAFEERVKDDLRRNMIEALNRTAGNIRSAAHELGVSRRTFYRNLYRLRLWPAVNDLRRKRVEGKRKRAESSLLANAV